MKIKNKSGGGGSGLGGQGGCERKIRRIEVFKFCEISYKIGSGVGGEVRVDVNEELKFL